MPYDAGPTDLFYTHQQRLLELSRQADFARLRFCRLCQSLLLHAFGDAVGRFAPPDAAAVYAEVEAYFAGLDPADVAGDAVQGRIRELDLRRERAWPGPDEFEEPDVEGEEYDRFRCVLEVDNCTAYLCGFALREHGPYPLARREDDLVGCANAVLNATDLRLDGGVEGEHARYSLEVESYARQADAFERIRAGETDVRRLFYPLPAWT